MIPRYLAVPRLTELAQQIGRSNPEVQDEVTILAHRVATWESAKDHYDGAAITAVITALRNLKEAHEETGEEMPADYWEENDAGIKISLTQALWETATF